MTQEELDKEGSRFGAMAATLDATYHYEWREGGELFMHGFLDSVQWIRTVLARGSLHEDGVGDDLVLHQINLRQSGIEDNRLHSRWVKSYEETERYVLMKTVEGWRLEFFRMEDDPSPHSQEQIREVFDYRERNREAYDRQTAAFHEEASFYNIPYERPE